MKFAREHIVRICEFVLGKLLGDDVPLVLQDTCGIRFIKYSWNCHPVEKLIDREPDKAQFEAMLILVRPGDLVFDVGAHIGFHSVFASRLVGSHGKVYAFEPVPDTYWMLREVLALNRCENVVPVRAAICDRVGTVKMNLFEPGYSVWNTMGTHTMTMPDGKTRIVPHDAVVVPSNTLDNFCSDQRLERIDFLKVDVEGFEKVVFIGAERLLRERRVNYICFEISQVPLKGAGIEAREVFETLASHGYRAYRFDERARTFFGPVCDSTEYWANYFASWQDLSSVQSTERLGESHLAS